MTDATQSSTGNSREGFRWFNAAIALTLASIALYVLGWFFWTAYLSRFGLSPRIVGFSFEQVLTSTWSFSAMVVAVTILLLRRSKFDSAASASLAVESVIVLVFVFGVTFGDGALHLSGWRRWVWFATAFVLFVLAATKLG